MTTKTTTFMDTMTKWAETNTAIMSSMTQTTQKCMEKSMTAGQTWTDGMTIATKRSQQAWADWMEKSKTHMGELSTSKDPSKSLESTIDFALSTACDAIETGSEISQMLVKSSSEAQATVTKSMLTGLESLKKDGAKVVKTTDMGANWTAAATPMTTWWTTPEQASKWMGATAWWTPSTTTSKTSAGETAASSEAVIASKASGKSGTSASK